MESQEPQTRTPVNRFRLYQEAKKIIEVRITFFVHLSIYLAVNALLLLINLSMAERTGYWFVWPAVFWGAGVLVHGIFVLLYSYKNIRRWQEEVRGRKKMEMLLGLTVHWSLFLLLNLLFFAINALSFQSGRHFGLWSVWVFLGWGIGIGFHSAWVYLNKDHKLKRWKRSKALQMLDGWGGLS